LKPGARGAVLRDKRRAGRVIARLASNAQVQVLSRDAAGWARVRTSDGLSGYLAKGSYRVDKTSAAG
jgi:hypothetical protein